MGNWIDQIRSDIDHVDRLQNDLLYFAEQLLKIRPKEGGVSPLVTNTAQRELHRCLEEQKAKTGKVRAIVLKARQMGISTYIAARFYKRTIQSPGLRTIIIAHEKPASNNLFKMVKRFNDHMPNDLRPSVGVSNAQELIFDKIDSGYGVTVATEEGSGRSDTAQSLHASEAAFWVDMAEQMSALMQTVPRIAGTEIIIESTGKEFGDDFHQFWRAAQAGENEFVPIFLPWSIDLGYRAQAPEDFTPTIDEAKLAEIHRLDKEQLYWRRLKIAELRSEELFKREYPLTPDEAFLASKFDSFITSDLVMNARKTTDIEPAGPLLLGIDPAGQGDDATAIAWRRGHRITKIERRRHLTTMEIAGWIASIIRNDKPAKVCIDVGGLGVGIYDRLIEQGHDNVVTAINFGSKPIEPPPLDDTGRPSGGPLNRRAEMWLNMKNVLQEGRFQIPDDDALHADLTSCGYKYDSAGRLVLESKQDMRKRGMPSPDSADAMALTFSEPDGSAIPGAALVNFRGPIEYAKTGWR
jgi:hypothetical protein